MAKSVVWIAHRGLLKGCAENTRRAFQNACAAGFNQLETDLRVTRDGHIVLCHDDSLARLCGIDDRPSTMTRANLEGLSASDGGSLFFFDQFVEEFAGHAWILDIKKETGLLAIRTLHAWSQKRGTERWLLGNARFLVWTADQRRELLRSFPEAVLLPARAECWRAGLANLVGLTARLAGIRAGATYALPPRLGRVLLYTPEIVARYKEAGARVMAYLPPSEADVEMALSAGVDELLMDWLPKARASTWVSSEGWIGGSRG